MKRIVLFAGLAIGVAITVSGQLSPGDIAIDFEMTNVDGERVGLSDYSDNKGVILVFTCNYCPFSKAYEQRVIKLHNDLASMKYSFIAINPNDEKISPDDSLEEMKRRSAEMNYPFEYLKDESQIFKAYGATRTPQFYILKNEGNGKFKVVYIGAFDNNAMDARSVSERYIFQAIGALENDMTPSIEYTEALGCTIKSN